MPQNLAQKRASDALQKIKDQVNYGGKYDSYVNSLPATIIMNGLGQAAAMLVASSKIAKNNRSDDNKAYEHLYTHLSSWLCRDDADAPYSKGDLLEAITSGTEEAYLKAQSEAMAYLEWLKKFSNAYLKD